MKLRVYADTSVFGGYFEEPFLAGSKALFEHFVKGDLRLVLSALTLQELLPAPKKVRDLIDSIPPAYVEPLDRSPRAAELADAYLASGTLTKNQLEDARHIAAATIAKVDYLVSWNFKHILHPQKMPEFNRVNLERGFSILKIRTPLDVIAQITKS